MMTEFILTAQPRDLVGKKVKNLRKKGLLPAVVYGHSLKPKALAIPYQEFEKVYQKAGKSTIISLVLPKEGKKKALIADVQTHPVTRRFLHADFHEVRMTEKITAEVPLKFVGVAPAVKERDGVLVKNMDTVEVSCLPSDLPHEIEVDISSLVDFDSSIHIKDLKVGSRVELTADPEEVVALVEPPRSEEELAALEEVPEEVKAPEVIAEEEAVEEEGVEALPKESSLEKTQSKEG